MRSKVAGGAVPKAQEEGVAVSAAVPSAPRSSVNKRGRLTHHGSVGGALTGVQKGTAPPLSARLYEDPCTEALDRRNSSPAAPHARTSNATHARPSSSVVPGRKTAAAAMRQPPPSLSAAAQPLGNAAAVEEAVACSTDEPSTGPSAVGCAVLSEAVKSRMSTTHPALRLPSAGVFAESPAAAAAPVRHAEVLCVALPEMPLPQTPQRVSAAGGGRLELRMRGLVALPCLHLSAAPKSPSLDARHESTTSSSVHGSGDVAAGRLHAVSFRQNAISSLSTQSVRAMSTSQASLIVPRSSPLQCYAHVSSLDLTHNALTSIAGIDALRCLRSLRLAFNRLTSLAPLWASRYVAQLDVLDVSSNALTELLSAEDVHALKRHQIRIVTHPTQAHSAAHGCPNAKCGVYKAMGLRVLYASGNKFCEVPSAIYTFTQLTDLRLSKNVIESVPDGFPVRACLPQLTRLDLSMNKLPAAMVEAVTARAEEVAESPLHRRRTSTTSPSFARVKGYRRASAHRSHGATDPSAGAKTAALSSSISSALKAGEDASSEEAGSGAVHGAECSRDIQSRVPGGAKENGRAAAEEGDGVSAVNGSGQRRSSASAAKVADDAESNGSRGTLLQLKADAAVSPQPPTKTRHESASATASSPSTRKATASLPPTAPAIATVSAQKSQQQDAVQCVAENVYSIDLSLWAAVVRRRLEEVLRRSPDSDASGAPGAASTFSMHELLVSLSDTLGGNSGGGGATALPRYRRRPAATARTMAALTQCLPSCSLSYSEEAQVRRPPLLLLTGISAAVAADESELLLYEVLALHIVHNCLCTAKSAAGGVSPPYAASTASSRALNSAELILQQACKYENSSEPLLRAEAPAADRASGGELPPLRPGSPGSGRGGGTARQLNFAVPLQTVHVIACTDTAATPHSSVSALWAYLTWRQRWEAAVSCRRLPHKSDYICELGMQAADKHASHPLSSDAPSVTSEANGSGTHAARHCAAVVPLYPFAANSPVPRAREEHWLHEYRPASYCVVPPAWELLYDLLLRPSALEKTSLKRPHVPAVPPLLAGVGSRVQHLRGTPVSLACVLLCAVDYSGCAGASPMCASPTSPVLRWPTPGTGGPAASGAGNGTCAITASHVPCEGVIRRALQWRQHSQQLWSHVEREANIVAAEQVTSCSMPLYSAEEVLQSRQAAVAALGSPGAHDTRLRCGLFGQNGVSEEAVESAAASEEEASQPQCRSLALAKPLSQLLRSASNTAASCSAEPCESKTATATDTTMRSREIEGCSTPAVAVGADGGSAPAAAVDAVGGEADEHGGIEGQDGADAAARFNEVRDDNTAGSAVSATATAAQTPELPAEDAWWLCEN
ncbi:hypothetical protein, unknown function [Leishmania donovani]|uniref:Leucine rich repeat family protein n=1 Tax=Leishmania donovani TaxID=5661 RepID=E9BAZ0_LEIDO|nr:hypothetical protein, unknown function [Leishmania donovani]TPP43142.1 Leucine rich repeat family protein [Leishmania donovani]CBZ32415.1 hypothetical protein, unknown function [Leishmania donovani]